MAVRFWVCHVGQDNLCSYPSDGASLTLTGTPLIHQVGVSLVQLAIERLTFSSFNPDHLLIGVGSGRKYQVHREAFLREDAVSFYLLGAYMTDGCIYGSQTLISSKDDDWLMQIRDHISPDKPIHKDKGRNLYNFRFNDTTSSNWLISYGCTPRKSLTLSLTKEIPSEYIRDFVRGMIDGDGSVCFFDYHNRGYDRTRVSVYLCSASEAIIDQVKEMIPSEFRVHKYTKMNKPDKIYMIRDHVVKNPAPQYILQSYNSNAQQLLQWLYYPGHVLSLPRKYEKAQQAIAHQFAYSYFSDADVKEMRRLHTTGVSQKKLARMYDTSQSVVSLIVRNLTHQNC